MGLTFGKTGTEKLKVNVTPVTCMASGASNTLIIGLIFGLLGAGIIGFLWGAAFSPITVTSTKTCIITKTDTFTKTVTRTLTARKVTTTKLLSGLLELRDVVIYINGTKIEAKTMWIIDFLQDSMTFCRNQPTITESLVRAFIEKASGEKDFIDIPGGAKIIPKEVIRTENGYEIIYDCYTLKAYTITT